MEMGGGRYRERECALSSRGKGRESGENAMAFQSYKNVNTLATELVSEAMRTEKRVNVREKLDRERGRGREGDRDSSSGKNWGKCTQSARLPRVLLILQLQVRCIPT